MRINELTESVSRGDMFEYLHQIKRDCDPYLNEVQRGSLGQYAMYRGVKRHNEPFIQKVTHSERRPADTPSRLHEYFNDYFEDRFGYRYRNGIFASGSQEITEQYGNAYIIFPTGNFSIIWSSQVEDLYSVMEEWGIDVEPDDDEDVDAYDESVEDFRRDVLTTYRPGRIHEALRSKHEIMIETDGYYAINQAWFSEFDLATQKEAQEFLNV